MRKVVALVPMKGNSERVPNKNLRDFNGKPLFYHIINTLLKSKFIDGVVVNTDSEAIKEAVYKEFQDRVIIHERPEEIQGDFVSMNEVINYDINHIESQYYVQTHSTNPLLSVSSLDAAISQMLNQEGNDFDSIFSVTKLQTRLYFKDNKPFNHDPNKLIRTQDLEPLFEENSNFFIFSKESFEKAGKKRIGLNPLMFEQNKIEAIDIDEPEDFLIAEAIQKLNIFK